MNYILYGYLDKRARFARPVGDWFFFGVCLFVCLFGLDGIVIEFDRIKGLVSRDRYIIWIGWVC